MTSAVLRSKIAPGKNEGARKRGEHANLFRSFPVQVHCAAQQKSRKINYKITK